MIPIEGNIVAEYNFDGCICRVSDKNFGHKTAAEQQADIERMNRNLCRIAWKIELELRAAGK